MKAVNATSQAAWAAACTPQAFKREAGGQWAALFKVQLHRFSCTLSSVTMHLHSAPFQRILTYL